MSQRQQETAVRVANVPAETFEAAQAASISFSPVSDARERSQSSAAIAPRLSAMRSISRRCHGSTCPFGCQLWRSPPPAAILQKPGCGGRTVVGGIVSPARRGGSAGCS